MEFEIVGPSVVQSYDVVKYHVPNGIYEWELPAAAPITVLDQSETTLKLRIKEVAKPVTFDLKYGN